MSVSFDWDFREDSQESEKPDQGKPPSGRRRWLRWGAFAIILIVVVGLLIRSWVVRRLKEADLAEDELRAVVELELRTIADGDAELFRSLQDPADPIWQERQVTRYVSPDAVLFVPAPGLSPADRPTEIEQIHFFGLSGRAELIRWFDPPTGIFTETHALPFHVTWFYRQDQDGNWYHVEPPGDYWGIPYSWHGTRLAVHATEIEAERIDPTARDLAILVLQSCLWMDCSEGAKYTLSFEDVSAAEMRDDVWAVPALYLTGLPIREDAHTAWRRAMEFWTVGILARAQLRDEASTERVIYRQLVSRLHGKLGLTAEPLTELTSPEVELLAQALTDRKEHSLWSLWSVKADPVLSEQNRLLEAEVAALLMYIEDRVGSGRLFELLPALDQYSELSDALRVVYGLDRVDFSSGWLAFLSNLTGVSIRRGTRVDSAQPNPGPLTPPSTPPAPPVPPGDDIAVNCGGRIWVGYVDGGDLFPLTVYGEDFQNLLWSPDGRWLLTAWQPRLARMRSVPYLLATDGSGGRLLADDSAQDGWQWPLGWSPDGRDAICAHTRFDSPDRNPTLEMFAINIESGETRPLPGLPAWSPEGERLAYVAISPQTLAGSVWLADTDWANPWRIAGGAWIWPGEVWSPDGSMLALVLSNDVSRLDSSGENAIAIFDVTSGRVTPFLTAAELTRAVLASEDGFVNDGSDRSVLREQMLNSFWVQGWSADGRSLLVSAYSVGSDPDYAQPVALVAIPLETFDETASIPPESGELRLLAYATGRSIDAVWSPTDPRRLTFAWATQGFYPEEATAFLLDLDAGPVYTATQSWNARWSPDGGWVAFGGLGEVAIVDKDGKNRITLAAGHSVCHEIAWNPVADLSKMDALSTR